MKLPAVLLASFAPFLPSVTHATPKAPAPPSFYVQSVEVSGVTIRASSRADKATIEAVRARIAKMLATAPTIAANFKSAKMELHIIARGEKITDLPEYAPFTGAATSDDNSFAHRFHGGKATGTMVACSEENVMRDATDPYPKDYDVCTHELAHAVLDVGIDPAAREKVIARYHAAMSEDLYDDVYAGTSFEEFFAEGSAHYFGYSGGGLSTSDPSTYALLDSLYGGAYANAASPVSDLKALTGAALTSAHSTPGRSITGVMLKNKSGAVLRACELDFDGKIGASSARLVPSGAEDSLASKDGTTIVLIDDKTKGIVATLELPANYGRFAIDDKMVSGQRAPTADELSRGSAPIRVALTSQ